MVTIAIIDSGIIQNYLKKDIVIRKCTKINCEYNDQIILSIEDTMETDDIHGTEVLNTIEKYSTECKKEYYIFNVFFEGKSSSYSVLEALKKCLEISQLDIIVMSLSCGNDFYNEYYNILNELYKKGVRIFSSLENESEYSIPATLPFVYGVGGKPIRKNDGYIFHKNREIQFIANNEYEFIYRTANSFFCFKGNSKANAIIVGIAISYINKYGKRDWEEYFSSNISDYHFYKMEIRQDFISSKNYDIDLANKAIESGLFKSYSDMCRKICYTSDNLKYIENFLLEQGIKIDWLSINYYEVCSFLRILKYIKNKSNKK